MELMEAIMKKAGNNPDGEAYIKPGDFGFDSSSEGTEECASYLRALPQIKCVKKIGKNQLSVHVKQ